MHTSPAFVSRAAFPELRITLVKPYRLSRRRVDARDFRCIQAPQCVDSTPCFVTRLIVPIKHSPRSARSRIDRLADAGDVPREHPGHRALQSQIVRQAISRTCDTGRDSETYRTSPGMRRPSHSICPLETKFRNRLRCTATLTELWFAGHPAHMPEVSGQPCRRGVSTYSCSVLRGRCSTIILGSRSPP